MPVEASFGALSVLAKRLIFAAFAVATFTWAVFPVFPALTRAGFFRSTSNEIGNSDH
jgi:hypothetical protein